MLDADAHWSDTETIGALKQRLSTLTPREAEVLDRVALGLTNKQIARALGISYRTVEVHRANAFLKLGINRATSAVRIVMRVEQAQQKDLRLSK